MTATGGNAPYAVTDPQTGEVKAVSWYAPALNTVLYRFSDAEVIYILTYGRVGSPMSAWGTDGGGPMNTQQLQTLVAYLHSIQIPRESCLPSETDTQTCVSGHLPAADQANIQKAAELDAQKLVDAGKYPTVQAALGEALFNLNLSSGAYSSRGATPRAGATATPVRAASVPTAGTSPAVRSTPTSTTKRT